MPWKVTAAASVKAPPNPMSSWSIPDVTSIVGPSAKGASGIMTPSCCHFNVHVSRVDCTDFTTMPTGITGSVGAAGTAGAGGHEAPAEPGMAGAGGHVAPAACSCTSGSSPLLARSSASACTREARLGAAQATSTEPTTSTRPAVAFHRRLTHGKRRAAQPRPTTEIVEASASKEAARAEAPPCGAAETAPTSRSRCCSAPRSMPVATIAAQGRSPAQAQLPS
mmetsp:Transcript_11861/g.26314  ORF Transcript_11861/g.26314 Transcript_11861/m.26314 type:complete len:223 (-) Transcript_11861:4-672(-)